MKNLQKYFPNSSVTELVETHSDFFEKNVKIKSTKTKITFTQDEIRWQPKEISEKIKSNDKWAITALLSVYDDQEHDEKQSASTHKTNKIGFSKFDAEILTNIAERIKQGKSPSEKEMAVIKNRMPKYRKQLANKSEPKQKGIILVATVAEDSWVVDEKQLSDIALASLISTTFLGETEEGYSDIILEKVNTFPIMLISEKTHKELREVVPNERIYIFSGEAISNNNIKVGQLNYIPIFPNDPNAADQISKMVKVNISQDFNEYFLTFRVHPNQVTDWATKFFGKKMEYDDALSKLYDVVNGKTLSVVTNILEMRETKLEVSNDIELYSILLQKYEKISFLDNIVAVKIGDVVYGVWRSHNVLRYRIFDKKDLKFTHYVWDIGTQTFKNEGEEELAPTIKSSFVDNLVTEKLMEGYPDLVEYMDTDKKVVFSTVDLEILESIKKRAKDRGSMRIAFPFTEFNDKFALEYSLSKIEKSGAIATSPLEDGILVQLKASLIDNLIDEYLEQLPKEQLNESIIPTNLKRHYNDEAIILVNYGETDLPGDIKWDHNYDSYCMLHKYDLYTLDYLKTAVKLGLSHLVKMSYQPTEIPPNAKPLVEYNPATVSMKDRLKMKKDGKYLAKIYPTYNETDHLLFVKDFNYRLSKQKESEILPSILIKKSFKDVALEPFIWDKKTCDNNADYFEKYNPKQWKEYQEVFNDKLASEKFKNYKKPTKANRNNQLQSFVAAMLGQPNDKSLFDGFSFKDVDGVIHIENKKGYAFVPEEYIKLAKLTTMQFLAFLNATTVKKKKHKLKVEKMDTSLSKDEEKQLMKDITVRKLKTGKLMCTFKGKPFQIIPQDDKFTVTIRNKDLGLLFDSEIDAMLHVKYIMEIQIIERKRKRKQKGGILRSRISFNVNDRLVVFHDGGFRIGTVTKVSLQSIEDHFISVLFDGYKKEAKFNTLDQNIMGLGIETSYPYIILPSQMHKFLSGSKSKSNSDKVTETSKKVGLDLNIHPEIAKELRLDSEIIKTRVRAFLNSLDGTIRVKPFLNVCHDFLLTHPIDLVDVPISDARYRRSHMGERVKLSVKAFLENHDIHDFTVTVAHEITHYKLDPVHKKVGKWFKTYIDDYVDFPPIRGQKEWRKLFFKMQQSLDMNFVVRKMPKFRHYDWQLIYGLTNYFELAAVLVSLYVTYPKTEAHRDLKKYGWDVMAKNFYNDFKSQLEK